MAFTPPGYGLSLLNAFDNSRFARVFQADHVTPSPRKSNVPTPPIRYQELHQFSGSFIDAPLDVYYDKEEKMPRPLQKPVLFFILLPISALILATCRKEETVAQESEDWKPIQLKAEILKNEKDRNRLHNILFLNEFYLNYDSIDTTRELKIQGAIEVTRIYTLNSFPGGRGGNLESLWRRRMSLLAEPGVSSLLCKRPIVQTRIRPSKTMVKGLRAAGQS